MLTYVGNGPYCYANSAAMLLESAGESVEPRLIEVLSGVGLGAIWVADSQTLFLSGLASAPDVGLSRSFGLLGFAVVEEAESDGDAIPIDALKLQLGNGPVLLGPLDMGELPYRPNASGANGADHFVLALHVEDGAVVVHDPAGYPAMPLGVEALDRAWRADLIAYRRGTYRRWHSPIRVERPGPMQIAEAAIDSFSRAYRESRAMCEPGTAIGPEAIEAAGSGHHESSSYLILGWSTCGDSHYLSVRGAPWTTPGTSATSIQSWPTSSAGKRGILPALTPQRAKSVGNPRRAPDSLGRPGTPC